ncbi:MAG: hypothetical protein JWN69_407 [Alphaproteobacteria bacterium]|nr:hypothetical protein [Alphaproteobacteria bacterium]
MATNARLTTPLERAQREAETARARLASTLDAVQERLRPSALANQAWTEVRDKGSELADEAVTAVKQRPVAASGLLVAFVLYLARQPLLSAASRLWSKDDEEGGQPE